MKYWVRDVLKENQTGKLFEISAIEMANYATEVFIVIEGVETKERKMFSLEEIDKRYQLIHEDTEK